MSIQSLRNWRKILLFLLGLAVFTSLALFGSDFLRRREEQRLIISNPDTELASVNDEVSGFGEADSATLAEGSLTEDIISRPTDGAASDSVATSLVPTATSLAGTASSASELVPTPTVVNGSSGLVPVYVSGAVVQPQLCYLQPDALWQDAVLAAGGLREDAARQYINFAAPIYSHQMIYIPSLAEWESGTTLPAVYPQLDSQEPAGQGLAAGSGSQGAAASSAKVSLSKADAAALTTIPGVGEKTAAQIISFRESNGPFESIEDVMKIPGIKEAKFAQMKDYVVP